MSTPKQPITQRFDEAFTKYASTPLKLVEENQISETTWNDDIFETQFRSQYIFKARPSLEEAASMGKAFLKFYLEGNPTLNLMNVCCGLFSAMKRDGFYICSENMFNTTTFKQNWESIGDSSFWNEETFLTYNNNSVKKGIASLAIFATDTSKTVDIIKARHWGKAIMDLLGNENAAEKQKAINILGYIVIQMYRLSVKDNTTVAAHIMNYTPGNLTKFWRLSSPLTPIAGPCDSAIVQYFEIFNRFSQPSDIFMTFLITSRMDPTNEKIIHPVLKAGCMVSLARLGLGSFAWLSKVCTKYQLDADAVLRYLCWPMFEAPVCYLLRFINEYATPSSNQHSWPWARMLHDGAFFQLSTRAHPLFAGVLVGIYDGASPDSDLFAIDQFRGVLTDEQIVWCCTYAKAVLKVINSMNEESAGSAQTLEVFKQLELIRAEETKIERRPRPRAQPTMVKGTSRDASVESQNSSGNESDNEMLPPN